MKLDRTLIGIRPRSILERLDLTFLLCGKLPLGILGSMMVGAVPCLLLNWWILQDPSEGAAVLVMVALIFELPFCTLFLTLYLGQMTFQRSFSATEAFKVLWSQMGPLFLYQVLLRGLVFITFVLSPVAMFGMYYMNEILLLERSSLKTSWTRRRVLHDDRVGDVIATRIVELLVFVVGLSLLHAVIVQGSQLWNDQTNFEQLFLTSNDYESEMDTMLTWQASVAFFMMVGFLGVYRYVSYLDTRIRHEGWDVELSLRTVAQSYASTTN